MDEITLREFNCKIDMVLEYLKNNNGFEYKLYNHDIFADEPDSDIVEYAMDIKEIVNNLNKVYLEELPF